MVSRIQCRKVGDLDCSISGEDIGVIKKSIMIILFWQSQLLRSLITELSDIRPQSGPRSHLLFGEACNRKAQSNWSKIMILKQIYQKP